MFELNDDEHFGNDQPLIKGKFTQLHQTVCVLGHLMYIQLIIIKSFYNSSAQATRGGEQEKFRKHDKKSKETLEENIVSLLYRRQLGRGNLTREMMGVVRKTSPCPVPLRIKSMPCRIKFFQKYTRTFVPRELRKFPVYMTHYRMYLSSVLIPCPRIFSENGTLLRNFYHKRSTGQAAHPVKKSARVPPPGTDIIPILTSEKYNLPFAHWNLNVGNLQIPSIQILNL